MARDQWPRSKAAVRLIKDGPMHDDGRCSFTLFWWQDGRRKAQCFFAKPEPMRRQLLNTIREKLK